MHTLTGSVLLHSFLVQNILKKVEENSERETNAIKAHKELEQVTDWSWVGFEKCNMLVNANYLCIM
jgi:hypothetical protein